MPSNEYIASAMDRDELARTIECLLFAAGEPVGVREMAKAADCDPNQIETGLRHLAERLESCGSGLMVVEIAGGWQLATRPAHAHVVRRLVAPNIHKLTRPTLETVTIVAYRQPCTLADVEAIRGVACGGILKTLEERGLLKIAGRKTTPGRPLLYATTDQFLHHFGLVNLADLPKPDDEAEPFGQPTLPLFEAQTALKSAGIQPITEEREVAL